MLCSDSGGSLLFLLKEKVTKSSSESQAFLFLGRSVFCRIRRGNGSVCGGLQVRDHAACYYWFLGGALFVTRDHLVKNKTLWSVTKQGAGTVLRIDVGASL